MRSTEAQIAAAGCVPSIMVLAKSMLEMEMSTIDVVLSSPEFYTFVCLGHRSFSSYFLSKHISISYPRYINSSFLLGVFTGAQR